MTILQPITTKQVYTFLLSQKGILVIIWACVQLLVIEHYGVVTSSDSPMYIEDATNLLNGEFPFGRSTWYASYSLFLASIFLLKGNILTVVIIQVLLSGVAACFLYRVAFNIFKDTIAAFITVLLYLLWIKIHQWNAYIYTESLFTSFSIISFSCMSLSRNKWQYSLVALLVIFTFFIRPAGLSFLCGVIGYLCVILIEKKYLSTISIIGIAMLLGALALFLLNYILSEYIYYFIKSYSHAEIIYPSIPLIIEAPSTIVTPSPTHSPLGQLVLFIVSNPIYFLKLSILKLLLFLSNIKPYFSILHNSLTVLVLFPCYAFAIYGFKKMTAVKEKIFILCFVASQAITVSLTSENWDGRFLIPILPFIFIYSGCGIAAACKK